MSREAPIGRCLVVADSEGIRGRGRGRLRPPRIGHRAVSELGDHVEVTVAVGKSGIRRTLGIPATGIFYTSASGHHAVVHNGS